MGTFPEFRLKVRPGIESIMNESKPIFKFRSFSAKRKGLLALLSALCLDNKKLSLIFQGSKVSPSMSASVRSLRVSGGPGAWVSYKKAAQLEHKRFFLTRLFLELVNGKRFARRLITGKVLIIRACENKHGKLFQMYCSVLS